MDGPQGFDLPSLEDFTSGRLKTLGWQVLDWGSAMLGQPDGEFKGKPWEYTPEQALFILRWYAVDENGKFIYRRAVLERVKGWGKSPLVAAICCTECFGPVRFDGWDANGEPVGRPAYSPLVQIAAISDSQADNTMVLVGAMLAEGPAADEIPGLDIMLSKVVGAGNRKIEKVTASPRGREGNRATFIVMDETHLWVPAEFGPELASALRRNAAKMNARTIETTNAHAPGEMSVAEASYNAFLKMQSGQTYDKGLLFDTVEAHVEDIYDKKQAMPALERVYGDASTKRGGWVDLERIFAEICDPDTPEHVARRFYFNEKIEGKSTWLRQREWNACHVPTLTWEPGEKFALGFKGQIRNGAASIVAYRLEDGALLNFGHWEKPENAEADWEVPFASVDARLRRLLQMDECTKLVADPENWQEIIGRIYADFPEKVEELWLTKNRAKAIRVYEQFETSVKQRRLKWSDPNISRHVMSCHAEEVPSGDPTKPAFIIRKETPHSTRYITAAQAAALALEAGVLSIEEGALKKVSKEIWSY